MAKSTFNYNRAVVIVHGKSELCLVKYIHTNLHLPIKPYAHNRGNSSIQITGLNKILKKRDFNNLKSFAEQYNIEYSRKTKELLNFKLFTIMDTDDCSATELSQYKTGRLFEDCTLREYIVPLYNTKNLEDVMMAAGIMTQKIQTSDKGVYYSKVFPICKEGSSTETVSQVRLFYEKIKDLENTNMRQFIEYCFSCLPDEKL